MDTKNGLHISYSGQKYPYNLEQLEALQLRFLAKEHAQWLQGEYVSFLRDAGVPEDEIRPMVLRELPGAVSILETEHDRLYFGQSGSGQPEPGSEGERLYNISKADLEEKQRVENERAAKENALEIARVEAEGGEPKLQKPKNVGPEVWHGFCSEVDCYNQLFRDQSAPGAEPDPVRRTEAVEARGQGEGGKGKPVGESKALCRSCAAAMAAAGVSAQSEKMKPAPGAQAFPKEGSNSGQGRGKAEASKPGTSSSGQGEGNPVPDPGGQSKENPGPSRGEELGGGGQVDPSASCRPKRSVASPDCGPVEGADEAGEDEKGPRSAEEAGGGAQESSRATENAESEQVKSVFSDLAEKYDLDMVTSDGASLSPGDIHARFSDHDALTPELRSNLRETLTSTGRGASRALGLAGAGMWANGVYEAFHDDTTSLDKAAALTAIVPFVGCGTQAGANAAGGQVDVVDTALCFTADALEMTPLWPVGLAVQGARFVAAEARTMGFPSADAFVDARDEGWQNRLEELRADGGMKKLVAKAAEVEHQQIEAHKAVVLHNAAEKIIEIENGDESDAVKQQMKTAAENAAAEQVESLSVNAREQSQAALHDYLVEESKQYNEEFIKQKVDIDQWKQPNWALELARLDSREDRESHISSFITALRYRNALPSVPSVDELRSDFQQARKDLEKEDQGGRQHDEPLDDDTEEPDKFRFGFPGQKGDPQQQQEHKQDAAQKTDEQTSSTTDGKDQSTSDLVQASDSALVPEESTEPPVGSLKGSSDQAGVVSPERSAETPDPAAVRVGVTDPAAVSAPGEAPVPAAAVPASGESGSPVVGGTPAKSAPAPAVDVAPVAGAFPPSEPVTGAVPASVNAAPGSGVSAPGDGTPAVAASVPAPASEGVQAPVDAALAAVPADASGAGAAVASVPVESVSAVGGGVPAEAVAAPAVDAVAVPVAVPVVGGVPAQPASASEAAEAAPASALASAPVAASASVSETAPAVAAPATEGVPVPVDGASAVAVADPALGAVAADAEPAPESVAPVSEGSVGVSDPAPVPVVAAVVPEADPAVSAPVQSPVSQDPVPAAVYVQEEQTPSAEQPAPVQEEQPAPVQEDSGVDQSGGWEGDGVS
ncbi:hypothetical protein OG389_00190 [Streptomyces sp. NBC_00435]|uniref:hypothetical protein n=1 Tax=Streptomyces sp. NBC_00435 TaxID=2903649 RepID=UPI002E21DD50